MAEWAIVSSILSGYPHIPDINPVLFDRLLPFRFVYSYNKLAWKHDAQILTGYPHIVYWDTTPAPPPANPPSFASIALDRTVGFVGVSKDLTVTVKGITDAQIGDELEFEVLDSQQTVVLQDTETLSQTGSLADFPYIFDAIDISALAAGNYSVKVSISRNSVLGHDASTAYTVKAKPYLTVTGLTPGQLQKPITSGQQLTIVYTINGDSSITAASTVFTLAGFTATHNVSSDILSPKTAYLTINDTIAAGQYTLKADSTFTVTGFGSLQTTLTTGYLLTITAAPIQNDPNFTGLSLSKTGRYIGNETDITVSVTGMTNIAAGDSMTVELLQGQTVKYTNTSALNAAITSYTHLIPASAFVGLSSGTYTVSARVTRGSFSVQKQTDYTVVSPPTIAFQGASPNIVHLPITAPFSLTTIWQVFGSGVDTITGSVTLAGTGFFALVNTTQLVFNAVISGINSVSVGNYALNAQFTISSAEYGSVNPSGTYPNALTVLPEIPVGPDLPKDLRAGDVYLYSGFELAAIFKSYISFKWVRRYNKVGEFALQLEKTRANIDILATGNIVMKENDDEAGFIEDITITDQIEVRGRFVSSILDYRIVSYRSESKVSLQATVNQLIADNFMHGDADRIISEMAIDPNAITDQQVTINIDNNSLTPWLEQQRVGYKVRFDPAHNLFWFKMYEGKNSDAIFMEDYRNVAEEQYFLQTSEYKNVVYVRSGDSSTGQTLSFGSAQGLARREGYLTAGSYEPAELGPRFLEDNAPKETLDIKIIDPYTPFEYRKDYDVGDIVKVISSQYAVEMATHILEITEYYDLTGFHLYIVFGDMPPSILTEIKDNSRNIDNMMNSRNEWLDNIIPDIAEQVIEQVQENLPDLPIDLEGLGDLVVQKIKDALDGLFDDLPQSAVDAITDIAETAVGDVLPDAVQDVLNEMGIGENANHIILDHLPTQTEIDTFAADSIILVYDPQDPFIPGA